MSILQTLTDMWLPYISIPFVARLLQIFFDGIEGPAHGMLEVKISQESWEDLIVPRSNLVKPGQTWSVRSGQTWLAEPEGWKVRMYRAT